MANSWKLLDLSMDLGNLHDVLDSISGQWSQISYIEVHNFMKPTK